MLPGATRTGSAQNNLIWSASAAFGLNQDRGHIGGSRAMGTASDGYASRPIFQNANALGAGGQRPGVVPGTVGHEAENPGGDDLQQELTRAACVRGHGDIGVRDLPAQIDAGGGFDGAGDVKPADLVRRVGAQQQLACCMPAAPADLIADAAGHLLPRAGRGACRPR